MKPPQAVRPDVMIPYEYPKIISYKMPHSEFDDSVQSLEICSIGLRAGIGYEELSRRRQKWRRKPIKEEMAVLLLIARIIDTRAPHPRYNCSNFPRTLKGL